jgi:DNA-binding response OmpR family regulator
MKNKEHTILAVDDTPSNLDILRDLLGGLYKIIIARSGIAAIDLIKRRGSMPNMILLDIMMPDLNGFDTLSLIRELPDSQDVPVIFISAMDDVLSKTHGFELGAVDYITKPFEPAEVLSRVHTHLTLADSKKTLAQQNIELLESAKLREDVERITRHD